MSTASHTLSIVCVSLNEETHLPDLKRAIDVLERPAGCGVETLLVDGGSKDTTVELAARLGFDHIECLPGADIPSCRNHGVRRATGDWIAFLDADCEPAPDWLIRAAPWLTAGPPSVLGWPAHPPDPGTWVQRAWHIHWSFKNRTWTELEGRRVITREAFRLLTTRNLLMHRQVFEILDGFDQTLATGEDTDFVRRAQHRRLRVIAVPDLRVMHHGEPATLGAFFRQQLWHANRQSYRMIRHTRAGNHAPLFTVLFLCSVSLALIGFCGSVLTHTAWPLFGVLPLGVVLTGPALVIAWRARRPGYVPALILLYAAYGLARAIDRLGMHPDKVSWKSSP